MGALKSLQEISFILPAVDDMLMSSKVFPYE